MKNFRNRNRLKDVNVLFVCMGNICRSPTALGVFQKLVHEASLQHVIGADSAGTYAYHAGEMPDPRAIAAAKKRGYDLSRIQARKVETLDFERFDYVLAMDNDNKQDLLEICGENHKKKIRLLLEFLRRSRVKEVPDPYYGGKRGFETVLDLVEEANRELLEFIKTMHSLRG